MVHDQPYIFSEEIEMVISALEKVSIADTAMMIRLKNRISLKYKIEKGLNPHQNKIARAGIYIFELFSLQDYFFYI